jgi:hypothetical protein
MNALERDRPLRMAQGDWEAYNLGIDTIRAAAADWKAQLQGLKRGWLCWNVDSQWCLMQQKLALKFGWTPVVGYDPRVGPPEYVLPEARLVHFNRQLNWPSMYPHIPLEFAFLWIEKLAFWHADFLIRVDKLAPIAKAFEGLSDGQIAAVPTRRISNIFSPKQARYWELLGCTTAKASASQFENGCGWWMNFWFHPNQSEKDRAQLQKYSWDHGGGINFWAHHCKNVVEEIPLDHIEEGHFSIIGNPNYKKSTESAHHYFRNLGDELSLNYPLVDSLRKLELSFLLEAK